MALIATKDLQKGPTRRRCAGPRRPTGNSASMNPPSKAAGKFRASRTPALCPRSNRSSGGGARATGSASIGRSADRRARHRRSPRRADAEARSSAEHRAKVRTIVLAASACESVRIMLNSKSARFPQGLANSSGRTTKTAPAASTCTRRGGCTRMPASLASHAAITSRRAAKSSAGRSRTVARRSHRAASSFTRSAARSWAGIRRLPSPTSSWDVKSSALRLEQSAQQAPIELPLLPLHGGCALRVGISGRQQLRIAAATRV